MRRLLPSFALAAGLIGLAAPLTRADVVIYLNDVTVSPGNTGTMDLTIKTDGADTLSGFNLQLQIAPVGSPTAPLLFTASQPNPYDPTSFPNFVFSGESFRGGNGFDFWTVDTVNNLASGGDLDDGSNLIDGTSGLGYVNLSATGAGPHSYLASVSFQASALATPGDQFQVSLVNDPGLTYFTDGSGNDLTYSVGTAPGFSGTVTIGPASVPEPTSLVGVLVGGSVLAARRLRRKRLAAAG